jgi:hypothetical protein
MFNRERLISLLFRRPGALRSRAARATVRTRAAGRAGFLVAEVLLVLAAPVKAAGTAAPAPSRI